MLVLAVVAILVSGSIGPGVVEAQPVQKRQRAANEARSTVLAWVAEYEAAGLLQPGRVDVFANLFRPGVSQNEAYSVFNATRDDLLALPPEAGSRALGPAAMKLINQVSQGARADGGPSLQGLPGSEPGGDSAAGVCEEECRHQYERCVVYCTAFLAACLALATTQGPIGAFTAIYCFVMFAAAFTWCDYQLGKCLRQCAKRPNEPEIKSCSVTEDQECVFTCKPNRQYEVFAEATPLKDGNVYTQYRVQAFCDGHHRKTCMARFPNGTNPCKDTWTEPFNGGGDGLCVGRGKGTGHCGIDPDG